MSELKRMAKLLNMPTTEGIRLGDVYTLASDKIEKLEAQLDASLPLIAELDLRVKAALRREEKLEAEQWQPIETAPKDGAVHIRGLWVNVKNAPQEFQQFIGCINDDGDFVDPDYYDDFGWAADDYTHWMPLPEPPETDNE